MIFRRDVFSRILQIVKAPVGLGLSLAWYYCFAYSCVLVWHSEFPRQAELYWSITMAFCFVVCVCMYRRIRKAKQIGNIKTLSFLASFAQATATVLIFTAYLLPTTDYVLIVIGAALAGITLPFSLALWLDALRLFENSIIEFSACAAMMLSVLIYVPLVSFKSVLSVVVVAALPLLSSLVLSRVFEVKVSTLNFHLHNKSISEKTNIHADTALVCNAESSDSSSTLSIENEECASIDRNVYSEVSAMLNGNDAPLPFNFVAVMKTAVLFAILWFSFIVLRVCVSPAYAPDRFIYYLLPLVCGALIASIISLLILIHSSRFTLNNTYRWTIPMLCSGFALYFLFNNSLSLAAYSVGFIGLIGLQLAFVVVVSKFSKMSNTSAFLITLIIFGAISAGVFLGVICGGIAFELSLQGQDINNIALLLIVILVAIMNLNTDIDDWKIPVQSPPSCVNCGPAGVCLLDKVPLSSGLVNIDEILRKKSDMIADEFSLSAREREILLFLLKGRSRPYIKDELVLSLNTVNTHVRNIFNKVDVHSQQELLTLANDEKYAN